MKFAIYHILHSDLKAALGDKGWDSDSPLVKAHLETSFGGSKKYKPEYFEFYTHVADAEAETLEDVFMMSNGMKDPSGMTIHIRSASLSVGHILIAEDGIKYMVDNFGFSEIA